MSSKNNKVGNRVKMSSSERKRSKRLRQSSSPLRERYLEDYTNLQKELSAAILRAY